MSAWPGVALGAPRVLYTGAEELAEGPAWAPATQELAWVDIPAARVHWARWGGSETRSEVLQLAPSVGFALPTRDGVIVGSGAEIAAYDRHGILYRRVAALGDLPHPLRINDAGVDPKGRLVFGTMDPEKSGRRASIHLVDDGGALRTLHEGMTISNGIAFSPDGGTIYFTDSFERTIYRARYGGRHGLGPVEVFATDPDGQPDGFAMDAAGCLWVASYGGGLVKRYSPDGAVVEIVAMPVAKPAGLCFAGADRATLVITASYAGEEPDARRPVVFGLPVAVPGLPVPLVTVS